MLGAIDRGEVDTFAADLTPSAQRLRYFEFCTPWLVNEYIVVSGKSVYDTFARRIALILRTFDSRTRVDCVKRGGVRMHCVKWLTQSTLSCSRRSFGWLSCGRR